MRGRNLYHQSIHLMWFLFVRFTPRDRLHWQERALLAIRHDRVVSLLRSCQVVSSLRLILMFRVLPLPDWTYKMFNMLLAFLTFHLEMTETKLRFLWRVTLPRHLNRIALAEEQALIYLGT